MFINYTNHPSENWSEKQKTAAAQYGEIIDMPFPDISPKTTIEKMNELVKGECNRIVETVENAEHSAVLCQGESVFTYMLVDALLKRRQGAYRWQSGLRSLKVLSAASERKVIEKKTGGVTQKISEFCFEGFREYSNGRINADSSNLAPSPYEKGKLDVNEQRKDRILITQLGNSAYQNTKYIDKNGETLSTTGYAFDAIVKKEKINKLMIIGTRDSGWSGVLEWYSLQLSDEKKKKADELGKQLVDKKKTFTNWEAIENFIKDAAHFDMVKIAIVENGSTEDQLKKYPQILLDKYKEIADQEKATRIIFDISNGFRSMPLYITMFVRYAGMISRKEIKYSMYYGMFEARTKDGKTPLVDLSTVSDLTDWVNAVSVFQSLGSVKGLCGCLEKEKQKNPEKQEEIKKIIDEFKQFDYAWNVNNPYYMERGIRYVTEQMNVDKLPLSEPAKLMLGSLKRDFFRQFGKQKKYKSSGLLLELSELFMEQGRYGVAAVAFQESLITYLMERYLKDYFMKELGIAPKEYESYIQRYENRQLVKRHWDRKVGDKGISWNGKMTIFMEDYLKIKDNIRNVESHMIPKEEIPELTEITKWMKEVFKLLKEDMACAANEGSLGFAKLCKGFNAAKDIILTFLRGKEGGKWNLLNTACPERKTPNCKALEIQKIPLEKIQRLRRQLVVVEEIYKKKTTKVYLNDLNQTPMVKKIAEYLEKEGSYARKSWGNSFDKLEEWCYKKPQIVLEVLKSPNI